MNIKTFTSQVSKEELLALAEASFGNMVKGVIDIQKKILALGSELHSDCEEILLDQGSKQVNLWGFNIYTDRTKEERLEYTSMINIRPKQNNMQREIQDPNLRKQIKDIIDNMVEA